MITKEKLIQCGQLLTYEEWYKLNETAFIATKTQMNPKELYNEYVEETLKNFLKNS